jgi:hypothetical protein
MSGWCRIVFLLSSVVGVIGAMVGEESSIVLYMRVLLGRQELIPYISALRRNPVKSQ